MLTAWGYEIDESGIPPLLSVEAFDDMTGGRYAGDLHAAAALTAASQAIRNACGWHIAPSLQCTFTAQRIGDADGRASRLFALPANAVTAVASVTEEGVLLDAGEYDWARDGLMRRACFKCWPTRWNAVEVSYTAGYDTEAVPDLAEAVRAIAEGVLVVTVGVTSESADGVQMSYSSSASSIAAALTDQQRAALAPYRLVMSHAA